VTTFTKWSQITLGLVTRAVSPLATGLIVRVSYGYGYTRGSGMGRNIRHGSGTGTGSIIGYGYGSGNWNGRPAHPYHAIVSYDGIYRKLDGRSATKTRPRPRPVLTVIFLVNLLYMRKVGLYNCFQAYNTVGLVHSLIFSAAFVKVTKVWHKEESDFSIFTALHVMQTRSSDENSVCPLVCPSVCHTRALWKNGRKIGPYFYIIRKII